MLAASVNSQTKSYITYLIQKFYFNLFLQEEVAYRYLNIRSFDKVFKYCCDEFFKSIFFGQELNGSYSNKSFLLPNNMFKKHEKN